MTAGRYFDRDAIERISAFLRGSGAPGGRRDGSNREAARKRPRKPASGLFAQIPSCCCRRGNATPPAGCPLAFARHDTSSLRHCYALGGRGPHHSSDERSSTGLDGHPTTAWCAHRPHVRSISLLADVVSECGCRGGLAMPDLRAHSPSTTWPAVFAVVQNVRALVGACNG